MTDSPALKILVADDTPANVMVIQAVASRLGHAVVAAGDGREAVRLYQEARPDLVFMDIMMPDMDGLAAVRDIRGLPADRWVPVVFVSALDRMEDVVRGLESGGDDYLVKPVDLRLLRAKINGYAHTLALQRKVRDYAAELEGWREQAEEQVRLGAHVMARLTDTAGLRDPMLRHFNQPADNFSGDLLCAARAPGDVLYLMLADAAGHGLPAALSAMPLTQVFHGMTAKGFSLASIAAELNRKLKGLMPADRFVAATLAAVDVRNQTVEVWNGGNPDAVFLDDAGGVAMRWPSRHPPLGILAESDFSGETQSARVQAAGDLLICSDGLLEAESPHGDRLSLEGVVDGLARAPLERRFQRLVDGLETHLDGGAAHDDVSFMLVRVPLERRQSVRMPVAAQVNLEALSEWRLDVSYGPAELRYLDVVPAALGVLGQIRPVQAHQGALFLVLSELFNNALDHGLLQLDSAVKEGLGGFELYLQQRAERLATLTAGRVDLGFHVHEVRGEAVLDISVRDSGQGFDFTSYGEGAAGEGDARPHGRGIALVRNLCRELIYEGCGNQVRARYVLA
jgi:CheY-like chemotaxis protein